MKRKVRNIIILLSPFILIVIVNEMAKIKMPPNDYEFKGYRTINTNSATNSECSWICHSNTGYCKSNHVKLLKSYFSTIDKLYFGLIGFLKSTGSYSIANVAILAILWPLLMFWLLISSLNMIKLLKLRQKIAGNE